MNSQEIAKQYNVPQKIVDKEYQKILASDRDPSEHEGLLAHVLRNITKGSRGVIYTGMVLAVDKVKDNAAPTKMKPSKRDAQMDAYVADPEQAVEEGKVAVVTKNDDESLTLKMRDYKTQSVTETVLTVEMYNDLEWDSLTFVFDDKKIIPLNDMKIWPVSKKPNFSYLKPLPLHEYRTTLLVVVKTNEGYKLAEMDYMSEKEIGNIPRYKTVEFSATPKESKGDGILHLVSNSLTEFTTTNEEFGKTPVELLNTFLKAITYPIAKLTDYHTQMVKDGKKWDTLVLIKAFVSDIRGIEKGAPFLTVNDNSLTPEDPDLKVWLHPGIDLNFGKNSTVYIIGKTSQGDKYDFETKQVLKGVPGDVTLWAMDVYVYYNTSPTNVQPISEINI